MKINTLILAACIAFVACQNDQVKKHEAKGNPKISSPVPVEIETVQKDTMQQDGNRIEKSSQQDSVKKVRKKLEEPLLIDVEVDKIYDPFEDPDYIGTPCDDINGRCTRHHHKNQDWQEQDFELNKDTSRIKMAF